MTSRRLAPHSLSRRGLLLAGAATVLLTACGDDDSGDSQGSDDAGLEGEVQTALVAGFADGFRVPPALVAGVPQRAPVALVRTDGVPLRDEAPAQLAVTLTSDTGFESELTLDRHGDGIPVPYFPMTFTLDDPGAFAPRAHVQIAERIGWMATAHELPMFERFPGM